MPTASLRYHQVRQKSVHNAFQRREGLYDQMLYWGARSLELDIHNAGRDWKIFHFQLDPETSVERLSDALAVLWGMGRAQREHEVVTVFLDLKDRFKGANTPGRLDRLLRRGLPRRVFTPRHLWDRAPSAATLQQAVALGSWPTLDELRGRFLFVLTGPLSRLTDYVDRGRRARRRVAFVAPRVTRRAQLDEADYAVFFNLADGNARRNLGPVIADRNLVSRSYTLNTPERWRHAVAHCVHHLATDKVNEVRDPWARTRDDRGWPFQVMDGPPPGSEPAAVEGIEVRSRDFWERQDSGFFYYDRVAPASADRRYDAFVASPTSHVQEWAKCGLMARASLGPDAPCFSVLRISRDQPLRVQYRSARGADTEASIRPVRGGHRIDSDGLVFVRLELSDRGKTARAWGSATARADEWILIDRQTFDEPLVYHGVCASSHDLRRGIRFLWAGLDGALPFRRARVLGGGTARGRHFRGPMG